MVEGVECDFGHVLLVVLGNFSHKDVKDDVAKYDRVVLLLPIKLN